MDGVVLLTDPVLRARVTHLRRAVPVPAELAPPDAILISHQHRDHLDVPSLRRFGMDVTLVAPPGASGLLRRRGFHTVTELRPGDETAIGGVTVRATHAGHAGSRTRGPSGLAVGYVLEGS